LLHSKPRLLADIDVLIKARKDETLENAAAEVKACDAAHELARKMRSLLGTQAAAKRAEAKKIRASAQAKARKGDFDTAKKANAAANSLFVEAETLERNVKKDEAELLAAEDDAAELTKAMDRAKDLQGRRQAELRRLKTEVAALISVNDFDQAETLAELVAAYTQVEAELVALAVYRYPDHVALVARMKMFGIFVGTLALILLPVAFRWIAKKKAREAKGKSWLAARAAASARRRRQNAEFAADAKASQGLFLYWISRSVENCVILCGELLHIILYGESSTDRRYAYYH
jgi:hypothetical protein